MTDSRARYAQALRPLLDAALRADNLFHWSGGVLTTSGRRLDDRLKDDATLVLETYLLAHSGLPARALDTDLITAFGDEMYRVCHDETLSLHTSYNATGWLLAGWLLLAEAELPPERPHVVLPVCAAVGTGVHAAAFLGIEQGARTLMHLAHSPNAPVRDAAAQGLRRMLAGGWPRALYELRRYVHVGNVRQYRAAALAITAPDLLTERAHALEALDLLHGILAAYRRLSSGQRLAEAVAALRAVLPEALTTVIAAERRAGFAAAQTWIAWQDAGITAIVDEAIALPPLALYEEAALLRRNTGNGHH